MVRRRAKGGRRRAVMADHATPSPVFLRWLAVLMALGHALLALTATRDKCVTADEIAHLAAGYTYNQRADFRLQPENGNLPQRWAALPLTWERSGTEPRSSPAWRKGNVWEFGHDLFYREGLSTDDLLFKGRAMIALFSAATALLVFSWSQALFGWRGGFLSLTLYTFCPAFLAHGALATSDVVMTFFFLASTGAWWRMLERPAFHRALLSAGVFGLACVAKFSAVLLVPILAGCTLLWWFTRSGSAQTSARQRKFAPLAGAVALHLLVAWIVIWAFYGFRFSAFGPGQEPAQFYRGDWAWILDDIGLIRGPLETLRDFHLLPEAFLYGFAFVVQFSRERAAFFSGEYGTSGWVSFFPFAFVVKSTLPFLLVLLAAVGAGIARWTRRHSRPIPWAQLRPLIPLGVLFAVYWISSLTSHLNIGHRHILPTYPVLFIAAGWLGRWVDRQRPLTTLFVIGALLWHTGESFRARPHYLAYFNALVGGSENGWRHLVDSSLDWGQDLPGLKRWLDRYAPNEPVHLSYFGTGDPAYEGIRATMLPSVPELGAPRPRHALTPGVYAIGATMLQQAYGPVRGDWTLALEKEFAQLRSLAPTLPRDENGEKAWKRFAQLRFARLCHYLRVRQPDGVVGYSIRIYRLTASELHAATGGSASDWQQAIAQAVQSSVGNRQE